MKTVQRIWKGFGRVDAHVYLNFHVKPYPLVSKLNFLLKSSISELGKPFILMAVMTNYLFLFCISDTWYAHLSVHIRHVFLASYQVKTCWDSFCLHLMVAKSETQFFRWMSWHMQKEGNRPQTCHKSTKTKIALDYS